MSFKDIRGIEQPLAIIRQYLKEADKASSRSFLFCGPEGVGKRLTALTLAKAINCREHSGDACGDCPSCKKVEQGNHPDIHFIDGSSTGSIKIEDIRQLQKDISLRPYEALKKAFIIDNAHNLTPEAANALLKVLEEPPKDSLIILISAKTALLFKTIISRCQMIKFYPMHRQALKEILAGEYGLENSRAHFIAYFSEGRIGQALALKDSAAFEDKNRIIDEFCFKAGRSSPRIADKQELRSALNTLAAWFRDIYLLKSGSALTELVNADRKDDLRKAADSRSFAELDTALGSISETLLRLEQNINVKLLLANLQLAG